MMLVISKPIDAKSLADATSRQGIRDGVTGATEMRGAYQLGLQSGVRGATDECEIIRQDTK